MEIEVLNNYRVKTGEWATDENAKFGLFMIPSLRGKQMMKVICAPMEESEWDHVSVSMRNRTPSWDEMAMIKRLFWAKDVTVIQFHVPETEHVNIHENCLHLWRNTKEEFKLPPKELV